MIVPQTIYHPLYTDSEKFIILITGGRGSGKSFNASTFIERLTFEMTPTEKIVHQILYTRYTMVSAGMSIIPEMMEKIELDGTTKYFKTTKTDIVNRMTGSRIMFRGIKTSSGNQTAKLKSIQGITTFVCDEAEEWTSEEEFDKIMLSIRKKGIQNRIIIIMNPCDSNHFIYKKYIENTHRMVEIDGVQVQISTHPNVLHIHTTYFDNIANLSPEFLREVEEMKEKNPEKYAHVVIGRWADVAEGAVFKKWGIVDEFPMWCKKVAIGQDFGYTNDPSASIRCGIVDNALYLDEVDYRTGLLSGDIIKTLRPWNLRVIADSADPRLIQEIHNGGIKIYAVEKGQGSVNAGIDKMQGMEIFITKRSYNLQREFRNYVWAKDKDGNYINEPEDHDNHCFVGETMIETLSGRKRIDSIKVGEYVLTSDGYRKVSKFFDNGYKKILYIRLIFSNFIVDIKATPEHKFKTKNGWKQLKDLTETDVLYTCKSLMGKNIVYTTENDISLVERKDFTEKCGNTSMEIYQKDTMSTTKTKTHGIMKLATLSLLRCTPICGFMRKNKMRMKKYLHNVERTWLKQVNMPPGGMAQKKAGNGIVSTLKNNLQTQSQRSSSVNGAERRFLQCRMELTDSVQTSARLHTDITQELTTKCGNANGAVENLLQTNTVEHGTVAKVAAESILQASEIKKIEIISENIASVYDLEVEDMHEFFANGVLVHNCIDAARYYVLGELLGRIMKPKDVSGIFGH
jgi:phage terminase large subunit